MNSQERNNFNLFDRKGGNHFKFYFIQKAKKQSLEMAQKDDLFIELLTDFKLESFRFVKDRERSLASSSFNDTLTLFR